MFEQRGVFQKEENAREKERGRELKNKEDRELRNEERGRLENKKFPRC